MNSYERFRELNLQRKEVQAEVNSHFIFKGYPSIKIINQADPSVSLQAAVVNKQEQEEAYIYTQLNDAIEVGSIWSAKNLHLMITEEITVIKDVNWHKYHAFLCNIEVDGLYGYFIGPEKKHIDLTLKQHTVLFSQQKPMLVLPGMPLSFQDKIMIKNRAWVVEEYDSISTDGITYYSLKATTMSKLPDGFDKDKTYIEKYETPVYEILDEPEVHSDYVAATSGTQATITTNNGYFKANTNILKVNKHTSSEVVFEIPFGISDFIINTKDEQGNIVTTIYKVQQ